MSSSRDVRRTTLQPGGCAISSARGSMVPNRGKSNCRFARRPLAASMLLLLNTQAWGATITVNNSAGGSVAGACTLRDAITSVNNQSSASGSTCAAGNGSNDTVVFGSGIVDIVFSVPASGKSSALAASASVTIDGGSLSASGAPTVTIERSTVSAVPNFRLIESNSDLTLKNLTIAGGSAATGENGGGIEMTAASTLSISGSVVTNNHSTGEIGGAIYGRTISVVNSTVSGNGLNSGDGCAGGAIAAAGTLTITGSQVVGNSGVCGAIHGGAIYANTVNLSDSVVSDNIGQSTGGGTIGLGGGVYGLTVNLTNSTISRNQLTVIGTNGFGAGVLLHSGTLTNSTISGNSSNGKGSGIYSLGIVNLYFCTITKNRTTLSGAAAGLSIGSGVAINTTASILFGNVGGSDVDGGYFPATLNGDRNLIGVHGSKVTVTSTALSCDPLLGSLGNNGGSSPTHGLLAGSCAIDAGPPSPSVVTDQRGVGFARKVGVASDIGAFEKQNADDPDLIFANGFEL
jgi:predicted outer membrane repeat protein